MQNKKTSLKLNDLGIRLVFIPFCALISLYFVVDLERDAGKFLITSLFVFAVVAVEWHVGRYAVILTRKWFPGVSSIKKRISIIFTVDMILGFFAFSTMLYFFVKNFKNVEVGYFECALVVSKETTFATTIFCLLVSAVYECIFFFDEWKTKVKEVEEYKKASLEAQYQNLKSQLNPHFLFNSFNTLARLIEENRDKALNFLQEFSDVYRYVLKSQEDNWISLKEELDFVTSYVFLLQMRYEKNLVVKYDVDPKFSSHVIPPLTLQMLVENAIKHNEISSDFPLFINISTTDKGFISVENNVNLRKQRDSSTKVGLKNICERYNFLSDHKVEIENSDEVFKVSIPTLKINDHDYERVNY